MKKPKVRIPVAPPTIVHKDKRSKIKVDDIWLENYELHPDASAFFGWFAFFDTLENLRVSFVDYALRDRAYERHKKRYSRS